MTMMVEELIATISSKKEVRSTAAKGSNNNAKIVRNTALLEALAKGGYVTSHTTEDGKKKRASQAKERHPSYWKPALQSIPEEH
uniref:Uncharacterized protein n=1 Tax=Chenopodium quinoa TaxID=63459 RepID=A0A803LGA0_CHEQI